MSAEEFRYSINDEQDAILSQEDTEALVMMGLRPIAKGLLNAVFAANGIDLDALTKIASNHCSKEQPTDRDLLRKLLAAPYASILRVFAGSFGKLGINGHVADEDTGSFKAAKVGLLALAREYPNRLDLVLYAHNVGLLRPDAKHETWLYETGSFTFGRRWNLKHISAPLAIFSENDWTEGIEILNREQEEFDRFLEDWKQP